MDNQRPGPEGHRDALTEVAGASYEQLIVEQLTEERARKSSLEQRGFSVITTSGAFVSLLFGLAAVVTQVEGFEVPAAARVTLMVAALLFTTAGVYGLIVNSPVGYKEADPDWMLGLTRKNTWEAMDSIGRRRVSQSRVETIRAARASNERKADRLVWALAIEVVGIAAVASTVVTVLLAS
jgi:hypothetical protein